MITQIKLQITQMITKLSLRALLCNLLVWDCFIASLLAMTFLFFAICHLPSAICQTAEERFIYDSRDRQDPFIPLLDKDSPTGLRTIFIPPEVRVELPVEITVKGILQKGEEFFAIINEEAMQKGDNLGEVKIKEIKKDKVIFEYEEREFTVFLRKEKEK